MRTSVGTAVIAILNCGSGDTKLSFDPGQPGEVDRARDIVTDMLRRGYCISVEVGDKTERVAGFDPARGEYLILDQPARGVEPGKEIVPAEKRPGGRRKGVPAKGRRAVAVGPTAGGGFGCRCFPPSAKELRDGRLHQV